MNHLDPQETDLEQSLLNGNNTAHVMSLTPGSKSILCNNPGEPDVGEPDGGEPERAEMGAKRPISASRVK